MERIKIQRKTSQIKAKPKAWKLKKRILQKKFTNSWRKKIRKLLVRVADGGVSQIRAAPIPISAYKILQTIGNTISGGVNEGFSKRS